MAAAPDPVVSVMVSGTARPADLRRCLQALLDTGYPALEVVAVVDGDEGAAVASLFPAVTQARSPSGQPHGGVLGPGQATGRYLALVGPDVVVEPDWIQGLVRFLEAHPDAAGAGGKVYRWSEGHPVGERDAPYLSYTTVDPRTCDARTRRDTPDQVREVVTLPGSAVMLRRQALEAVGPVLLEPALLGAYQETDLCARLLVQGWRLYYTGRPAAWRRVEDPERPLTGPDLSRLHRNRTLFAYRNLGPAGLKALLRRQRARDLLDRLRVRLGPLLPPDPRVEARREAQRWIDGQRALLERQRAGAAHTRDERWAAAVRRVQAPGALAPVAEAGG